MILGLNNLEKVLEKGTKVALIYGDRDYRCNCKVTFFVTLWLYLDSG
jgi:hypothetical protein